MSPRARTSLVVAVLAVLAAAVVAGAAVLSADERDSGAATAAQPQPRKGFPHLELSLGVRDDAEARELRRAAELYGAGRRKEAARIFVRFDSLEAKLGAAFSAWPASEDRIEQLGALFPRSALVQLHVGLARYWAGTGGALGAWREARDVEPDTPYAVRADDLIHRVHELPFRRAGMRRAAPDRDENLRRVEHLRLDLAGRGAVERVRVLGAEALEVEVLGAAGDLLVDREADTNRSVPTVGIPLQIRDRGHDLGDTGLVVGPEQRRAVRADEVVAHLPFQQGQLLGIEHHARIAGKLDPAAVVAAVNLGVDAGPRHVRRGVDVRDQPDRRHRLGAVERAVDVAVLVEPDVVEPDLLQLVAQEPREVELLLGRRGRRRAGGGLRIDADVAQEALEHVVRELRRERRGELGLR